MEIVVRYSLHFSNNAGQWAVIIARTRINVEQVRVGHVLTHGRDPAD